MLQQRVIAPAIAAAAREAFPPFPPSPPSSPAAEGRGGAWRGGAPGVEGPTGAVGAGTGQGGGAAAVEAAQLVGEPSVSDMVVAIAALAEARPARAWQWQVRHGNTNIQLCYLYYIRQWDPPKWPAWSWLPRRWLRRGPPRPRLAMAGGTKIPPNRPGAAATHQPPPHHTPTPPHPTTPPRHPTTQHPHNPTTPPLAEARPARAWHWQALKGPGASLT
jgi:hypothetical protein